MRVLPFAPSPRAALRCAVCGRRVDGGVRAVIVGLWSGWTCSARCSTVVFSPTWHPPQDAPRLTDGAVAAAAER